MDEDIINRESYSGRKHDQESFKRLSDLNEDETEILKTIIDKITPFELSKKIKPFDLSDETLRAIQNDLLKRLSRFDSESSGIKTKIKKIDKILHLRKKPILDK